MSISRLRTFSPTWLAVAMLPLALFTACGGTHSAPTTQAASSQPSTAPTTRSEPADIKGRLLTANELGGFTSSGETVYSTIRSWVTADQLPPTPAAAETEMLRRTGFRRAAREDLINGGNTGGLSVVEQFRTAQAARAALAFYVGLAKTPDPGMFKPFTVHGIPRAYGLGDTENSGVNIAFSDGPYYYLVGEMGGGPTTIAELNAAALHLYRRVHRQQ
jgi:hypothetical protein